jgi:transcriptional regulator with XRE-family HTH domain
MVYREPLLPLQVGGSPYSDFVYELQRFGVLLRKWRGRVQPVGVGPGDANDSRRTPGLRREELAELSDVSADYIKRLEQGRARPSFQVLTSIARALALSRAEYEHLCLLTGHATTQPGQVNRLIGPSTRRLLNGLESVPVAVCDATLTRLAGNTLFTALFGDTVRRTRRDRNSVWRYFTHTTTGTLESPRQAEQYEAALVADLRETAGRYPADPDLAALITALHTASTRFTELWHSTTIAKFETGRVLVDHPDAGPIRTDGNILTIPEGDLRLLVYTADPGSADAAKLAAIRPLAGAVR